MVVPTAFSTRLGGVSEGIYSSMNVSIYQEVIRRKQCVKITGGWERP